MAFSVRAQRLVEVGKGFSSTSVNTTVFRNNSIVTHGNTQYISYYDAEGWLMLGKRRLGTGEWILHRTQYKGHVKDAHNIISMMVDGDGYLHLSFDHHGHKLNYCRSIAPDTLVLGDKEPMIGNEEEDVTYPEFHLLADGGLLFVYRSGASGRGNMVMNRYDVKSRKWERVQDVLVDGENERNAYWQLYVDQSGTIHLSWVWREYDRSVACAENAVTNHDLGYAYSDDGGMTWQNSAGAIIGRTGTGDMIGLGDEHLVAEISINAALINQETQRIDSEGRFHTVVSYVPEPYWDDGCVSDFTAGRVAHAMPVHFWRDIDGVWHSKQIPFLQGDVGRAKVVFDSQDNVYVVLPDLRIVAASAAMQWQDWRLVYDAAAISIDGEVIIDSQRAAAVNILSVIYQEANDGVSASALRIADFQLGTLR